MELPRRISRIPMKVGRSDGKLARGLVVALFLFGGSHSFGEIHEHSEGDLGSVHFPISCSAATQQKFERAVILLHHMTYPQAQKAFQDITESDSTCAMAYSGIAMTLFQPVWPTRPSRADLRRGWTAIDRAISINPPTERSVY